MTENRIARTIQDVAELLSDYDVQILLVEGAAIEFHFPVSKEDAEKIKLTSKYILSYYNPDQVRDEYRKVSLTVRGTIRSLVANPQFWRCTTVADQLGRFSLTNKDFGNLKVRKRKDEPLTLFFETPKQAKRFFVKIKKSKLFEEIKK